MSSRPLNCWGQAATKLKSHTSCVNVHLSRHDLFNCELEVPSRGRTRLRLRHTSRRGNGRVSASIDHTTQPQATPCSLHVRCSAKRMLRLMKVISQHPFAAQELRGHACMPSLARSRSRALHCCKSLSLSCLYLGHALPAPGFIHNTPSGPHDDKYHGSFVSTPTQPRPTGHGLSLELWGVH